VSRGGGHGTHVVLVCPVALLDRCSRIVGG
jgi:hypothetical protein